MRNRTRVIKDFKTNSEEKEVIRVELSHTSDRRFKGLKLSANTVIPNNNGFTTYTNIIMNSASKGVFPMPRFNAKKFTAFIPNDSDVLEVANESAKNAGLEIIQD